MNMFGGGFTGPPNSACKLRQGVQQQPQFTVPVRQLGAVPIQPSFGVLPPAAVAPTLPPAPAPQAPPLHVVPALGVQPQQNVRGMARPVAPSPAIQPNSPIGPTSYKVMKKGEAPCPVCRG
jgi:hypothetical protein